MKLVKIHVYRSDAQPSENGVVIFEDSDGWFYLKQLVKTEGLATPFFSIDEVEVYAECKLKHDFSLDVDEQGNIVKPPQE